jgi:CHAT domain-containing protein
LNNIESSNILHFATHGYFSPRLTIKNEFLLGLNKNFDNCGLALAGANNLFLKGKSSAIFGDGVLTGNEISTFDLHNTKLVILSACQTALGDIRGNEGVFGLQRAFKMAGAEYIIASLWKVPDAETAEMMILFYENLAKKESIEDAFRNAQLKMRKKYLPHYWAGFVLTR